MKSTISSLISSLGFLARNAATITKGIRDVESCESKDDLCTLKALISELQRDIAETAQRIEHLEERRVAQTGEACKKLLSRVKEIRSNITGEKPPKSLPNLKKNLALVFEGPKVSVLNSEELVSKNKKTQQRCERIRQLNPDGLLSWAVSLAPTI